MSRLALLREDRAEVEAEARALNEKYPTGTRMPQAEAEKLDRLLGKIDRIDGDIAQQGQMQASAGARLNRSADNWIVNDEPVRALRTPEDIRAHYQSRGALGDHGDTTLAAFVRGIAGLPTTETVRAALSEGTDSAGGFLVPSFIMPQVLEALVPASAVLSAGAAILPLDMGAKSFTLSAIDTVPTAAWRSENGAVAESDAVFRAVVAQPKSLAFYFKVSRELLADASNLQGALTIAIAQSFAKELDRVALRGSGTAPEPRGILNTSNVLSATNGANGAALASYANLFSAMQAILQADGPAPTAAIMSPRSLVKLGGLTDTTGQPVARPSMLDRVDMLSTSIVPNALTVGTSTDCSEIYVGSFGRLVFAMRERMSIQRLSEAFATSGQVGFICHVRADVMVQYPKAFCVVTGVRP